MHRLIIVILVLGLLLSLFACGKKAGEDKKLIVVSIHPYELLVRQIVGQDIRVQTLIPANASPHTFSPKPRELKELQSAELVLVNGYGLETNLRQALESVEDKLLRVEDMLRTPPGQADAELNPHVWLSPRRLQQLVIMLNDRLQTAFPEHKDTIANNSVDIISQLAALDARIRQERDTFAKTPMITFHDSFHHFQNDYDLEYLGSVQSSPGNEPTPRELSRIGDLIREHGLQAIFVEPQMDRKSATVLADEFGLEIIELDPLGYSFKPKTIMDVILNNWEGMKLSWQ
ncbi:MAG: metal ABC transporter substrate-binding protein [Candidatus Syntrophosphaera sp.]|nr:metal ABC transporter substrate-binding protein [Candidatus Syntrophosphaera sp.]